MRTFGQDIHETARIHHIAWWRSGEFAARGGRAAACNAGDRISQPTVALTKARILWPRSIGDWPKPEPLKARILLSNTVGGQAYYDRLPALAAELVRRPVAVLVSVGGEPAALAAKAATATIPIVAVFVDDPVERGLVASLSRPGGNVTGISGLNGTLEAKRLGLLREVVPQATTLGLLLNPTFPAAARQLRDMQEAARVIGVQLRVFNAGTDPEIDAAFETIAQQRIPGLVVAADTLFVTHRDQTRGPGHAARGPDDV